MRIIAGKFKGLHLVSFKADHIRPTTDRVKETLFNILMGQFEDVKVLDLFAGTGNLGLEALSRGAQKVIFVEKHPKSIHILEANLKQLKVDKGDYQIIKKDVLGFLKSDFSETYDVIFADPPFTEKMAHDVMLHLQNAKCVGDQSIIAIESQKKERMEELYGDLKRFDARDFGDKVLSFFSRSHVN